jgi:hypothetical protein
MSDLFAAVIIQQMRLGSSYCLSSPCPCVDKLVAPGDNGAVTVRWFVPLLWISLVVVAVALACTVPIELAAGPFSPLRPRPFPGASIESV